MDTIDGYGISSEKLTNEMVQALKVKASADLDVDDEN